MIVLFEGCDKAGKTTLKNDVLKRLREANQDSQVLTYKLVEKPVDDTSVAYFQYKAIFDLAEQNPEALIVIDRSYISELVYSKVKRDYDAFEDDRYLQLAQREDVLLVYVETPADIIKQRIKTEGDDYLSTDDVDQILERYEDFWWMNGHVGLRIDGQSDRDKNTKEVIDRITEMQNEHRRHTN